MAPSERLAAQRWTAQWLVPEKQPGKFGVFLFRKNFFLAAVPKTFVIHLSADNRYHFWVNGQYVTEGPPLGDPRHWHFESLEIAPLLRPGNNVLGVQVIAFGGAALLYSNG